MSLKVCQLLIYLFKIKLCWRSIHFLNNPLPEVDFEILQLWSLVAFHKIYIHSGLEIIFSLFPFYFHFQITLLLITILPLNFSPFWFDLLLVPMMRSIHQLLDIDWAPIIMTQIVMLPWRIIDLVLFPGFLSERIYNKMNITTSSIFDPSLSCDAITEKYKKTVGFYNFIKDSPIVSSLPKNKLNNDDIPLIPIRSKRNFSNSSSTGKIINDNLLTQHDNKLLSPRLHTKEFEQANSGSKKSDQFNRVSNGIPYIKRKSLVFADNDDQASKFRRKLSEKVHSLVIGDSNIRIRDFVFDLDLPELPSYHHKQSIITNSLDRNNFIIRYRERKGYTIWTGKSFDNFPDKNVLGRKLQSAVKRTLYCTAPRRRNFPPIEKFKNPHLKKELTLFSLDDEKLHMKWEKLRIKVSSRIDFSRRTKKKKSNINISYLSEKNLIPRRSKRLALKTII